MKKYKLIKLYPGSPTLGTIVRTSDKEEYPGFYYENGSYCHYGDIIERFPEFWEKVVEKDYEILSYISKLKKCNIEPKNPLFNNGDWDIYSILRLSDSEIFTVGDRVDSIGKIKSFELEECNDISVHGKKSLDSLQYIQHLN